MTMEQRQALADLHAEIAGLMEEIENLIAGYGLGMNRISLVARNPRNENMSVVLTNEPDKERWKAGALLKGD